MSKLPYFKFMVADWLSGDIQCADMHTQGVFINLCALAWKGGGQVTITERTARRLHLEFAALEQAVDELVSDGCLLVIEQCTYSTEFIQEQLSHRLDIGAKRSAAGRKGGKAKAKQKLSKSQANATCDSDSDSVSESFSIFWKEYPRKVGKANARKAWAKHKCHEKLDAILSALDLQKRLEDWTKEGGKFVPHAATWINGERWEDEVQSKPSDVYPPAPKLELTPEQLKHDEELRKKAEREAELYMKGLL